MNQILESIDKSLMNLENIKQLQAQKIKELEQCKHQIEVLSEFNSFQINSGTLSKGFNFAESNMKCSSHIKKMLISEIEMKAEKLIYEIENFISHNINA